MYTYCTKAEDDKKAVQALSEVTYVILDCEGSNRGTNSGALSLISLGTPHAESIYLFDVLALGPIVLRSLLSSILLSESKTKIVWDGRMDFSELYFEYGCELVGCLDLQLVDIISRAYRGESDDCRSRRLGWPDFRWGKVAKFQVEGIHKLGGLSGALIEHGVLNVPSINKTVKAIQKSNSSECWMRRPLDNVLLTSAAEDIQRLAAIHDHFVAKFYINRLNAAHLLECSDRYVSTCRSTGRPEIKDIIYQHQHCGLLPFCALDTAPSESIKSTGTNRPKSVECKACGYTLESHDFPVVASKKDVKNGRYVGKQSAERTDTCKICTLILARSNM